jgi:hypothetical protein
MKFVREAFHVGVMGYYWVYLAIQQLISLRTQIRMDV